MICKVFGSTKARVWLFVISIMIFWPFFRELACLLFHQNHPISPRSSLQHYDVMRLIERSWKYFLRLFMGKGVILNLTTHILPLIFATCFTTTFNWRKEQLRLGEYNWYVWGTTLGGLLAILITQSYMCLLRYGEHGPIGGGLALMGLPYIVVLAAYIGIVIGYLLTRLVLHDKHNNP
jgi:hypothetical protein